MSIENHIYSKLSRIIPNMETHLAQGTAAGKSTSEGFMDLNFDYLGKDERGWHTIALSHNYEQNGDLVPDPDMQIRINTEAKTAEAMTFQNIYLYQQVYEEIEGKLYRREKLQKQLNLFLSQWLSNALAQGHRIDLSKAGREHETDTPDSETRKDELKDIRNKDTNEPEQGIER